LKLDPGGECPDLKTFNEVAKSDGGVCYKTLDGKLPMIWSYTKGGGSGEGDGVLGGRPPK
jgi:hypothetical protein